MDRNVNMVENADLLLKEFLLKNSIIFIEGFLPIFSLFLLIGLKFHSF